MSTLAVVVPAYDEELTIADCLDDLLAQSRPFDEIIVVDNGSTDRTGDIVDKYSIEHPRVRRVVEPTPGVANALRRGIESATSDLVARTDADSRVGPGWAREVEDFLDSDDGRDYSAVTGPVFIHDGPSYDFTRRMAMRSLGRLAEGSEVRSLFGPNFAVRRSAWDAVADSVQTRPDIWEDLDLSIAFLDAGHRMYFQPTMTVDTSCRQLRHSPLGNRQYILGGIRTMRGRGDETRTRQMYVDLPFRVIAFTVMWLYFRPWDQAAGNWRVHRLLIPLRRRRPLATTRR